MAARSPVGVVLVAASLVAACVPAPGRPSAAASGGLAVSPSPTIAPPASGPSVRPTFIRPTPTPLPSFTVHVVAPGETLTAIARRYGTSAFSIAIWNRARHPTLDPLADEYAPDRIQVGWQLDLIPNAEADEEDLLPAPTSSTGGPSRTGGPAAPPGGDLTPAPSDGDG